MDAAVVAGGGVSENTGNLDWYCHTEGADTAPVTDSGRQTDSVNGAVGG